MTIAESQVDRTVDCKRLQRQIAPAAVSGRRDPRCIGMAALLWCGALSASCSSDMNSQPNRAQPPSSGPTGNESPNKPNGTSGTSGPADNSSTPILMTPADAAVAVADPMTPAPVTGPEVIDQAGMGNPAGLADADAKKVIAGGPLGSLKWLYPYEATVFPLGMLAPLLMWDGGQADAAYLHIHSLTFDYKGLLKPALSDSTMAPQLQIPQAVWDKAGQHTQGKTDTFTIELSVRASGLVAGPITLHVIIAQAPMRGSIYYNTYSSALPGAAGGGNVLRIQAGGKAELFVSTTCNGCHSVSADGSRLVSALNYTQGTSFQLAPGGGTNPTGTSAGARAAFAALYPDGSKYLSTSTALNVGFQALLMGSAPADALLYDTSSGNMLPNTGIPTGAMMPMFSPDGTRLVFNDFAINMGHGLASMTYDVKNDRASDYKMLTMDDASATLRPGWPFFLPDDQGIVFVSTDSSTFSGDFAGLGEGATGGGIFGTASSTSGPTAGPKGDLYVVDARTGTITILAKAMGFDTAADATSDTTYLPYGAEELHHSYFPTVMPVGAGGYFWVFFDAMRHYGNLGTQRQLWGAAIDIRADGNYTSDLSHPAFYLPGQEFGTGNHRAFATLDPCKPNGGSCTSGIDCCGGVCMLPISTELVEPVGTCAPQQNACAKRDERCTTSADCCPPTGSEPPNSCIAGFCTFVSLN